MDRKAETSSVFKRASELQGVKLNLFHSMEVLFPYYFQSISRIFPYQGKHFH